MPIEMKQGALIDYTRGPSDSVSVANAHHGMGSARRVHRQTARRPYALWVHRHVFRQVPGGSEIRDDIDYKLPFGPLGRLAHWFVKAEMVALPVLCEPIVSLMAYLDSCHCRLLSSHELYDRVDDGWRSDEQIVSVRRSLDHEMRRPAQMAHRLRGVSRRRPTVQRSAHEEGRDH